MIKLVNVNIDEFKSTIYPEYLKLFPDSERKTYKMIERCVKDNILKIIKILDEENFVGFLIINILENNKYIILDYLGILPEYQHKGYGTEAIKLLKESSTSYNGIFIEVEKIGLGLNEKENKIRQKRVEFYERIGFEKLKFDLELYNVVFSLYILKTASIKEEDEKIIKEIFKIYNAILGEKIVKDKCKII